MKNYWDKQLFYQFYKEFSLKTEGNMGPQVYEPSTFSLQPYVASVLASFSCSIHSDCKHSMGVIWLSFCTTPLAKQSEPISSSLHEVLTQQYHHIGFPGCWQWATPSTSQKSRNYESNNNNNNIQLGTHKQCKATEKQTSSDLCSFYSWLLSCIAHKWQLRQRHLRSEHEHSGAAVCNVHTTLAEGKALIPAYNLFFTSVVSVESFALCY